MATKTPDLRKLKDQATKALEKRNYGKAADLYLEIAESEDDPDWRQRAGEALRKDGQNEKAVTQLTLAANAYAKEGFLLKAIAVCKVVLQLDPMHTETQTILAELYAQRDGTVPKAPSALAPSRPPVRAPAPPAGAPAQAPRAAPPPAPVARVAEAIPLALDRAEAVGIDDFAKRTPTLPPGAPMDVVPLASVLGGRKSAQMPAVTPSDYGVQLDGSAYEIDLDVAPAPVSDPALLLNSEVAAPAPLPVLTTTGKHAPIALSSTADEPDLTVAVPVRPLPSAPPADEMDFSGVMDAPASVPARPPPPAPPAGEMDFSAVMDDAPAKSPVPIAPPTDEMDFSEVMTDAPQPAKPPVPAAPPADELDFSMVMDDAQPLPAGPRVAPAAAPAPKPAPALPRIPLFSSLEPHELRALIEGVAVRDFDEGDTILKQGERGLSLFVIVRGQVEVVLEGPPQKEIATLGEGAFFGELALLTDFPRSATVVAQVDTQCLEISRELLARVIADSPDVLKTMLRFFRDRMLDRFLNSDELFTRFNADDARTLMGRFKFLEIDPKARVVTEGQRASGLYLLLCGEAQVVQGSVAIAKLGPGDVFGEMSMLSRKPAMANIDTVSKCWALHLPATDFQEIMLTYPQLLEYVSTVAEGRRVDNL